ADIVAEAVMNGADGAEHELEIGAAYRPLNSFPFLGALRLRHLLLDPPENGMALGVAHLDLDLVAPFEEAGHGLAVLDRLDHALFGDARIAAPALRHRLARPAVRIAVRHRARADNRAGGEIARLGCVGDELAEVERHVRASVRSPERLAVERHMHGQMQFAVAPRFA